MTKIKKTKKFGRGVFSTKKIKKGDLIFIDPILLIKENHISVKSIVYSYWYAFDKKHNCLALGKGSLFNHSLTPNVKGKLNKKNKTLSFFALQNINKNEQLFINYGYEP